jgi:hypothetical protein
MCLSHLPECESLDKKILRNQVSCRGIQSTEKRYRGTQVHRISQVKYRASQGSKRRDKWHTRVIVNPKMDGRNRARWRVPSSPPSIRQARLLSHRGLHSTQALGHVTPRVRVPHTAWAGRVYLRPKTQTFPKSVRRTRRWSSLSRRRICSFRVPPPPLCPAPASILRRVYPSPSSRALPSRSDL